MLDSSGNYAGGFFYGQHLRPSNPDQCYELNEELSFLIGQDIDSSNFLNTTTVVPFFVHLVNAKYVTYVDSSVKVSFQLFSLWAYPNSIFFAVAETRNPPNGLHAGVMLVRWFNPSNVLCVASSRSWATKGHRTRWSQSALSELQVLFWHKFHHNYVRVKNQSKF